MAWTAPMTAVANTAFTASQFNQFIRDNLLETAPAKATEDGAYFTATGLNAIAERVAVSASTLVSETTTNAEYGDLPTPGPSVTVETGTSALVIVHGQVGTTAGSGTARMSYLTTGETDIAPANNRSVAYGGVAGGRIIASTATLHGAGAGLELNPGQNTFTCVYQASSGTTAQFQHRRILVFPL